MSDKFYEQISCKKNLDAKLTTIYADVLVIGGGYAGNFAAIKAAEAGAKVVMAVKGRSGRSGLTPWANSYFVFHETMGITREDYYKQFEWSGEYLCNMDYVNALMDESYLRYLELSEWGALTGRENYYESGTITRSIEVVGAGDALRRKSVACGVQLLERVMMTTLIKPGDKVEGAIGFHMESGHPYAVIAKSTIICTGPSSLRPLGFGFPCSSATADGDAMAYRVGAEIGGKEFNDAHPDKMSNTFAPVVEDTRKPPMELGGGPGGATGPAQVLYGDAIGMRLTTVGIVHEEGLPLDLGAMRAKGSKGQTKGHQTAATPPPATGGPGGGPPGGGAPGGGRGAPAAPSGFATVGMSNHKAEGLFPHDAYGKSSVPGLWAAGDSLSTMQNGAGYAGFGCSSAGSSVQGARAGKVAAEAAKDVETPQVAEAYLEALKEEMFKPMKLAKGYSPAWVIQLMQNIMFPYFVIYIKEKSRMEAALSQIMYLQQKFADNLRVEDFHDLRVAHEARNMLLNAEMKMRAGLAREESRGTHIREDFPYRDDENFLCWIKLVKGEDGVMKAVKHPLPKEWHPDPTLPYRERYHVPCPGEDAYLAAHNIT